MTLLPILLGTVLSSDPLLSSHVRETAYARIEKALKMAADSQLLEAIAAKNQVAETLSQIRRKDEEWIKNPRYPLRKELTQNACSDRLRSLIKGDPIVVEALLMDNRGALVCSTIETSDYWQGDEDKWTKTFNEGSRVFVGPPALDANTNLVAVQLSVPVRGEGRPIGALTLTLKIPGSPEVAKK